MLLRRQLLQTALSLPLLRLLGDVAQAQMPRPLNFVCIYHPHGVCAEYWAQRASDIERDFDIRYDNCSLQPFDDPATYGKSFKDKLLIIEGLDHLCRPSGGDPETWLPLAKLNRYSYSKVARFMQRLDALGALDNTLIYVTSDMGNPSRHSTQNVPTLLCGGAGGKFRMGRRIRLQVDCSDQSFTCEPGQPSYAGVSNNHLLISIAHAFGVELEEFGTQAEDKHKRGPLSGLA